MLKSKVEEQRLSNDDHVPLDHDSGFSYHSYVQVKTTWLFIHLTLYSLVPKLTWMAFLLV